jgi:TfoX/Sxy family transcriptional regulator of competence genes
MSTMTATMIAQWTSSKHLGKVDDLLDSRFVKAGKVHDWRSKQRVAVAIEASSRGYSSQTVESRFVWQS